MPKGHERPHVSGDLQGLGVTRRFTEHKVTHVVIWFSVRHKMRVIQTVCGRNFETYNRVKNNRPVTCVVCLCRC